MKETIHVDDNEPAEEVHNVQTGDVVVDGMVKETTYKSRKVFVPTQGLLRCHLCH